MGLHHSTLPSSEWTVKVNLPTMMKQIRVKSPTNRLLIPNKKGSQMRRRLVNFSGSVIKTTFSFVTLATKIHFTCYGLQFQISNIQIKQGTMTQNYTLT